MKTRKATGFKSQQVNCCEINQVISKQIWTNSQKKVQNRKVTIIIQFYIFEIV